METKFKFKKIENEINYFMFQPSYYGDDGKPINFEIQNDDGTYDIDEVPFSISEFEKKGYKYKGSFYECEDGYGDDDTQPTIVYEFIPSSQSILIFSSEFSIKECIIVINMVMKQLEEDRKHSYCVFFDYDGYVNGSYFHHDASHTGAWWSEFTRLFLSCKNDINVICIELTEEDNEFNGRMYKQPIISIHLTRIDDE